MRKLLSLIISVVMLLSLASVSYAYEVNPVNENVTISLNPHTLEGGKVVISICATIDGTFAKKESSGKGGSKKTVGKGFDDWDIVIYYNTEYFTDISAVEPWAGIINDEDDHVRLANSAGSWFWDEYDDTALADVTLVLKDTNMTLDDIKSKTDLVSYGISSARLAEYPEEGAVGSDSDTSAGYKYATRYSANAAQGTFNYPLIVKTGVAEAPEEPEKTPPVVGNVDKTQTIKENNKDVPVLAWNVVVYQNDLAENRLTAILTNTDAEQDDQTQEVALTWDAALFNDKEKLFGSVIGGGQASFNVFVKVSEDHFNDNISLKIKTNSLTNATN